MISDGMHYSWSSSVTPQLQLNSTDLNHPPLTNSDVTLLETIYLIGGLTALPFMMYFPDKFGRKNTIFGAILSSFISWSLIAIYPDIKTFCVSRFLAGMSADTGYVSIPMYISEISDKNIRGALNGLTYIQLTIGVLIIMTIGPFISVNKSALIGVFINLFALISFIFIRESPYFYLKRQQRNKAEESLKILRCSENVKIELDELEEAVRRQEKEKGRFMDLISSRSNRKALILVVIVFCLVNISCVPIIFMNVNTILKETSDHFFPSEYGAILFSSTLLIVGIIATLFVDKIGRKKLLIFSGISTSATLIVLATYSLLQYLESDWAKTHNWIPFICIILYAVGMRSGLGIVPFILNGELFPMSVKSKGMTVADCFYLISGIICVVFYRELKESYGMYIPIYFLGCFTLIITLIVSVKLPETKGKTLEEIQIMLLK
ncbi:facilitated trehalose transporter Tret1-like [Onthophagus taurus]|uniref:facilitated trehalose transporter Tret1-like n=1 Tax=Onthophagus taurus TaxID=166361 RepID=UPI0039BE5A89